ncbi:RNA polymerase sigma factor SigY [Clostridium sp. MSJ-11]|uniref:RNA polymerase sigma factor SigY n=1 Tax=Clostridium mobile TaxID=2841512 RepID=A0ABS6ECG3_9CLOT|nr:RNA polymerase sigma factor SigY [Clostridium mobile]MBU5482879.1 RNA polymerase sigma factor SigY [Clostridium mobile]
MVEEKALVQSAKAGDKEAMTLLINNNYNILKGYVIKLTGNTEEAKDIIQETLLRAIVNIDKFTPKYRFSTWLITIATNLYRDKLRRNKNILSFNEEIEITKDNLENKVLNNILIKQALEILQELPYEKRTTFILKHYYNFTYEEIANIMKCPVGTVRSRLHNSIKTLIKKMKERGIIDE